MERKLTDLSPSVQVVILAIVPVVLGAVGFWYLVWPLSKKLSSVRAEVASLRAQNQKNQALERDREELKKRLADLEVELNTFRAIVPDEPAPDELVKMVRDAESASSVHVRTFVAQPIVAQEMYMEMPFKMRLDGTYYALVGFFNRLMQAQRIVGLSSLSLGAPSVAGSGKYTVDPEATVGVNCVLTAYFNRPRSMEVPKKK